MLRAVAPRPRRRSGLARIELAPAPPSPEEQDSLSDNPRRWAPAAAPVAQMATCEAHAAVQFETCLRYRAGMGRCTVAWLLCSGSGSFDLPDHAARGFWIWVQAVTY